jgi:hypothetical protein
LRNYITVANDITVSVCSTEYSSDFEVQDDVPNCKNVQEKACSIIDGENVCKMVPRQECAIIKQTNAKQSQTTDCNSVPKKVCGYQACPIVSAGQICRNEIKTVRK